MDYYDNPAISSSSLSSFIHDPSYYHKVYVTKEIPKKESDSLLLGNLVHCLILEPDEFDKRYKQTNCKEPSGMMLPYVQQIIKESLSSPDGQIIHYDNLSDEAKLAAFTASGYKGTSETIFEKFKKDTVATEYYAQAIEIKKNNFTAITTDLYNKAVALKDIALTSIFWDKMFPERNLPDMGGYKRLTEVEVFWNQKVKIEGEEPFEMPVKAKLDELFYKIEDNKIRVVYNDYKTDSNNPVHKYPETFKFWRTDRQLAMYCLAVYQWIKQNFPDITEDNMSVNILVTPIDTVRMKSCIYHIGNAVIMPAISEILYALADLKWHQDNNKWDYPKNFYTEKPFIYEPVLSNN